MAGKGEGCWPSSGPEGQRSRGCVAVQGGGQVLVWGWVGQAAERRSEEFNHDSVGSLEAAVGFLGRRGT